MDGQDLLGMEPNDRMQLLENLLGAQDSSSPLQYRHHILGKVTMISVDEVPICSRLFAFPRTDVPMPARKMRVRMQHKHHIYIHNDLASAAYFYRQKVEANKDVKGGVDGSYFDMMSCVTMTAFALEAKVNYLGDQLLGRKWRERDSTYEKLKKLCRHLKIRFDLDAKPFTAYTYLKDVRDQLAHGKPEIIEVDREVAGTIEEIEAMQTKLRGEWEYQIKPDLVLDNYDQAQELWKLLLEASGLTLFDTITHGGGGLTYIEDVVET